MSSKAAILIPAYQPAAGLPEWVATLASDSRIESIVIVDDGSSAEHGGIFSTVASIPKVTLLRHERNLGKGAALKTGLRHVLSTTPDAAGVVTADADGQHKVPDILRVSEALLENPRSLILGARSFTTAVPARSLIGNQLTRVILRLTTGQTLSDTQTGLRGIPMDLIPLITRLDPTGYDYELDMLITAGRAHRAILEVPIETVYEAGNRSSHFNPLMDSMRIYFVFIRFSAVSLMTALLDNAVFAAAFMLGLELLTSQVLARLTAGTFQYFANKRRTFHAQVRDRYAMPKYWLTVVATGSASYFLIRLLHHGLGLAVLPAKLLAETALFFISFVVLRDWVFAGQRSSGGNEPAA
jgi:putative flippase GtrA